MTRMTKAAFLSLSLLFVACDKEETAEPEQEGAEVEGEHKRGGFMAKFDADGDGAISREEAKGHRFEAKFAELDADGDGKLTREEFKAMRGHHGDRGGWHKDPEERAAKLLAKFDSNGDGALARDEVAGGKLADKFDEADGDKDGKLTRDELKALKGRGKHGEGPHGEGHRKDPAERAAMMLAKFDVDSDGALSADEVAEHRFLADKFAEADGDKDGKLTRDELVAFKQAHHGDKHGDKHRGGPRGE
ncbi:EF-hand domain-containing protein [Nannocystis sp. SCPEA4]|uniref:EF-hand domain-containing protein n=1 Tax=Nannocystis sp. SCPEA4 TaxID=2996787 RepID=UPI00226ECB95|nr:EF-hand domain-containing protein [Nannocystis sp. SCPEA4]MCY1060531.1 EF-hand domain-containing protein [Nannocystis sp. SCPEA4]